MKIRAHCLLVGALVALPLGAPTASFAEETNPSCVCPVSAAQPSGAVGSIASVSGSVLVSHTASFVAAEQGVPLSTGSRVVTGAKSSADLLIGGACSLSLGANSSATVVKQGDQLCVRVVGQETTASTSTQTLPPRQSEYGQQGQTNRPAFGAPELLFLGALGGAGLGAALDDDDDEVECVSAGC